MPEGYHDIADVPALRQQRTVNKLIFVGFFLFAPFLWLACLVCLTGDVYTDEVGDDGLLVTVSPATKWASVVVLSLHSFIWYHILQAWLS